MKLSRCKSTIYVTIASIFTVLIFFLVLQIVALKSDHAHLPGESEIAKIQFKGTYSVDHLRGLHELPAPDSYFPGNVLTLDYSKNHYVTLHGSFSKDIPAGKKIIFKSEYLNIALYKGSVKLFTYGGSGTHPFFKKNGGYTWVWFVSPGISSTDNIRIELYNPLVIGCRSAYNSFFNEMYSGSVITLLWKEIQKNISFVLVGLIFIVSGLILLLLLSFSKIRHLPEANSMAVLSLIGIFGGVWHCASYELISLLIPYPAYIDVLAYGSLYLLITIVPLYFETYFTSKCKVVAWSLFWISIIGTTVMFVLQMLGVIDLFGIATVVYLLFLVAMLVFLVSAAGYESYIIQNKNTKILFYSTSIFLLCLLLSLSRDYFISFRSALNLNLIGAMIFIISQFIFILMRINKYITEREMLLDIKSELTENKIRIMLSKIQPHFLYNSLAGIKLLCETNPAKAQEAIDNFANFMRGNFDSLSAQELVPFEDELNHTKQYLALEQMRFGDRLKVMYNIKTSLFCLPPFTLQPIVENAIRYGVTKKKDGGTVTIATKENKNECIITITDDGVGFNPLEMNEEDNSFSGITSVRDRLSLLCNGELLIHSETGKGTEVKIIIPQI